MNYIKDRVCLNVLSGSLENAKEIYEASDKYTVIGVLSSNYENVASAVTDMKIYNEVLEGNLSVGLGAGNPNQWKAVMEIAKEVKANHFNQVFTAVGQTRVSVNNDTAHINALVSPSGVVGKVIISTGPLSGTSVNPGVIDIETAILMIKDMGGNSVKFFPMKGLFCRDELIAVAKACAKHDFILEPTGGIDLENYEEILEIILKAGVKKTIPHVYSSIIDKDSGNTRISDVKILIEITNRVLEKY